MEKKIVELFDYRQLPTLMKVGHYDRESSLFKGLIDLQVAIYELDSYLESTWKIKRSELKKYWKAMDECLANLGVPKNKRTDYLKQIRIYQKHELAMRDGKSPTSFDLEYYYYFKSCDVKLTRRIVYDYVPQLKKSYSLADWRIFDLATEINDDVEDIYEDIDNINGNCFLFSLIIFGPKATAKTFKSFLDTLTIRAKERFSGESKSEKKILKWTVDEIRKTKKLVDHQIKHLNLKKINKATVRDIAEHSKKKKALNLV